MGLFDFGKKKSISDFPTIDSPEKKKSNDFAPIEKEDLLIQKYGLCPPQQYHEEIKGLLRDEIENHDNSEGCGDYLRVLCFMLFFIGKVEDCELVWKAKHLNMDTASMIDVGLLCGAGYQQTIDFLSSNQELSEIKTYLEKCKNCGDTLEKESVVDDFKDYYKRTN